MTGGRCPTQERARWTAWVFVALATACRRGEQVRPDPPPPTASASASAAPETGPPSPEKTGTSFPSPVALSHWKTGALAVYEDGAEGSPALFAQALDRKGSRLSGGSTRIASDGAAAIDVDVRDGHAWVVWSPRDAKKWTLRAARMDGAASIQPPASIVDLSTATPMRDPLVRVLALSDGGAFVLAAGPESAAGCMPTAHPPGTTACRGPSIDAFRLSPTGSVTKVFRHAFDGGFPLEVQGLVEANGWVVSMTNAWIGGPTFDAVAVPLAGGALRMLGGTCRPPFQVAFTGSEVVSVCPADYAASGESCSLPGDGLSCARVIRDVLGTPKPHTVVRHTQRCAAGRHTLEWFDADGATTTLDPEAPGASMRLDEIWTGERLLSLDAGTVVSRRCRP